MAGSIESLLAKLPPGFVTLGVHDGRCQANYRPEGSAGWAVVSADDPVVALRNLLDQGVNGHPVFRQDDVEELL